MSLLKCEHCGTVLYTINEDGLIIEAHGGLGDAAHGICKCGHGYHYTLANHYLKRLLAHYNHQGVEV